MQANKLVLEVDIKDKPFFREYALNQAYEAVSNIETLSIEEFEQKVMSAKRMLDSLNKRMDLPKRAFTTPARASTTTELPLMSDSGGYDRKWILAKKATYVLKLLGCVSTTRAIGDYIGRVEHLNEQETTKVVRALGATLKQRMDTEADFNRTEDSDGIIYWGIAEWFNNDGSVKHEYAKK